MLVDGLTELGVEIVDDPAGPFVLARVGDGVHARLRSAGYAVRRADTFPGLDATWVRIAVRRPDTTRKLLAVLRTEGGARDAEEPRVGERMGTVTLVGGGPGDPGLVTVAGREAIATADVILTDRLVPGPHWPGPAPTPRSSTSPRHRAVAPPTRTRSTGS